MDNHGFTIKKRLKSFTFAFNGIKLLIKNEHNAWIHCFVAIITLIAGCLLHISTTEWISVIFCIGLVLAAECINSAIEKLCDVVSPQYNEQIKKTKDMAAGAVLLTAITAAVIGFIIFLPAIIKLI